MTTVVLIPETSHSPVPAPLVPSQAHTSGVRVETQRGVPLTMPSAQEYYWRSRWQKGERETLATIEDGDAVVFDSDDPEDVVRWLHEPDEDEDGPYADQDGA